MRKIRKYKDGEEAKIQIAIIAMLEKKGWFVKVMHGNLYQSGVPDLYAAKRRCGTRWIEVKKPVGYSFTEAQHRDFPRMASEGVGIWILVAATEIEFQKLFKPANWWVYYARLKI